VEFRKVKKTDSLQIIYPLSFAGFGHAPRFNQHLSLSIHQLLAFLFFFAFSMRSIAFQSYKSESQKSQTECPRIGHLKFRDFGFAHGFGTLG